jgi:hypothetical protein
LAKLGIDQFDEDDMRVLGVLASHAAVAIENARLFERERTAAHVAQELVKLSQALTGVPDVQGVLREALKAIPAMIECSDVLVYLRASDTGDFQRAASETSVAETKLPAVVSAEVASEFLLSMDRPFVLTKEVVPPFLRTCEAAPTAKR